MFYNDPSQGNQPWPTSPQGHQPWPTPPQGNQPWPTPSYPPQVGNVSGSPVGQTMPVTEHMHVSQPGYIPSLPPVVVTRKPGRSGARTGAIIALTCVIILVFCVGLFSGWVFANTQKSGNSSSANAATSGQSSTAGNSSAGSTLSALEAQQEAIITKFGPAVVQIDGTSSQESTIGSGVIINKEGDIVTNKHVVTGTGSLQVVLSNGTTEAAQVVGTSATNDLAIVSIPPFANMTVATLADSAQLTVGEDVLAIGNPLGFTGSVTSGVISALNRSLSEPGENGSGGMNLTGLIQTSAAINPGNSGGALINLQGQLIGMPTLSALDTETNTPANGIGFAIPSNQIQQAMTQILGG